MKSFQPPAVMYVIYARNMFGTEWVSHQSTEDLEYAKTMLHGFSYQQTNKDQETIVFLPRSLFDVEKQIKSGREEKTENN